MSDDNAQQIEHWNGEGGERWVEGQAAMDAVLAPFSRLLLERAAPQTGERVLDVGCGCGDTSLALAELGTEVLGVDVSESMLERARERAAGRKELRFVLADAAAHPFAPASFDLLLSRFGVMFFADPVAAFTNMRRGHAEGGRLCFVCWQTPAKNPWMTVPMRAAAAFVPELEAPVPGAPGPFAFVDPQRVTSILEAAGYRDVSVEPHDVLLRYGASLEETMSLVLRLGPASRILAVLSPAVQTAAVDAIREALRAFETPDGVWLGSGAFLVTARN
jgi:SAM-dependent methyltransferase